LTLQLGPSLVRENCRCNKFLFDSGLWQKTRLQLDLWLREDVTEPLAELGPSEADGEGGRKTLNG